MKKKLLWLFILLIIGIIMVSCAPKGISEEKTAKRDDFGCWPPSCSLIPDSFGKQMCEDWKAGKQIQWFDCSMMAAFPKCVKLCEFEKNNSENVQQDFPTIPSNQMPTGGQMPPSPSGSSTEFLFHTRTPVCVDAAKDYHAQLAYVRPSDAPDRYTEKSAQMKTWIAQANGIVNNNAEKFAVTVDIKVACNGDEISVLNIVLPKTEAEFNTHDGKTKDAIAEGMKALGYGGSKTKYLIYYDGNSDGCQGGKAKCSGQFVTRGMDDRLSEDNLYNSGPDYSILFDPGLAELAQKSGSTLEMIAPIGMLHEFSHTLGAVQSSAPHTSGDATAESGHCNDEPPQNQGGNDVMCKSDIQGTVFTEACKSAGFAFQYDCNNDDYFNPKPEPGSYLATHWNLGSPLNRFFLFGESNNDISQDSSPGNYPVPEYSGSGQMPSYPSYPQQ